MQEITIVKADNGFILTHDNGTEIFVSESKLIKRVRELLTGDVSVIETAE
jgi:S-adenosylmethionine hydrolase